MLLNSIKKIIKFQITPIQTSNLLSIYFMRRYALMPCKMCRKIVKFWQKQRNINSENWFLHKCVVLCAYNNQDRGRGAGIELDCLKVMIPCL